MQFRQKIHRELVHKFLNWNIIWYHNILSIESLIYNQLYWNKRSALYICSISPNSHYQILNVDRLEKIRRGTYGLIDEYSDNSTANNDIFGGSAEMQYQHDSAESSVEGKHAK